MLNRKIILCLLVAVILLTGCSDEVRYKVISFIFDGVPNPEEKEKVVLSDTLNVSDSVVNQQLLTELETPNIIFHSPYQKRKCIECHNQSSMGGMQNKMPELCYKCHENLGNKYKVLHGPVDAGYCNACHHPHYSKNENLLLKTGRELCLDCHLSEDIYSNKIHAKQESTLCTDCHNVHGGDDISLQKPGTCYACHENLKDKYKYLHGPVGGGYCKSCHGLHTLGTKYLLIREGRPLCLHCHDSERIMETETHKEISDANCTDCHNAHGGVTMDFLY